MLNALITMLKRYPAMAIGALTVIAMLGGSMVIEFPADKKIKQIEIQIAQTWQQRQSWEQQQQIYHRQKEIEAIEWRMRWIDNEINRIQMIPKYLDRGATPEELWQIEQFRQEWSILQDRLYQLKQ